MKEQEMNLTKIKDYIIKKYPDSCLTTNYQNNKNYYDECEEELIEECTNFFYYEKLNWCGCGSPEIAKIVIRDFLKILDTDMKDKDIDWQIRSEKKHKMMKERFGVDSVYDNELLLCFAYAMDAAEFTKHGSSIGGAWISDEGKMFLWLLERDEELKEEK